MIIDIPKVCRVCLNEGKMMSVFKVNISKKIMACASVQVWPKDKLPDQICNKCSAKLHISFQFKKLCEKSDARLRQYLLKLKEKEVVGKDNKCPASGECMLQPAESVFIESTPVLNIQPEHEQVIGNQENFIPIVQTSQISYNVQTNMDCNVQNILQVQTFDGEYLIPINQIQGANMEQHQILDQMHVPQVQVQNEIQQQELHQLEQSQIMKNKGEGLEKAIRNDKNMRKKKKKNGMFVKEKEDTRCKVCGKIMATLSKLNRHMCIHTKDPSYKCSICLKGFSHSGNFKIHMRMHNDERPFKCNICGQGCRQAQDLEKHMRTHTGERPHACHLCTKAFATRSNLIAHIRTHTGERPYVCCVCQKAFCQSNELTKHMRTHTGEKSHICDICHKGFNGSSSLTVHRRFHTGERPYTCKICDKTFTQSHTLKVHLKLHSDTEVNCNECDKTFGTSNEMRIHKTTHS